MSAPDSAFQAAAHGATQQLKGDLRAQVDAETYREILNVAREVLAKLPRNERLGTLTAGLMLAATAYAEGAANAHRFLEDDGK